MPGVVGPTPVKQPRPCRRVTLSRMGDTAVRPSSDAQLNWRWVASSPSASSVSTASARAGDEALGVLVRLEVGEHVVGERPPVAAARPADADAQAQEVLRAEVLRDRAQPVVAREPAAQPRLQPAELEIALVVDDEDRVRLDLEERAPPP